MDKHSSLLQRFSGCQYTRDIVLLYFPTIRCPKTRKRAFGRKIGETRGMYERMVAKGYQEGSTFLTPQVIAVIVEFWGLPDEVEWLRRCEEQQRDVPGKKN